MEGEGRQSGISSEKKIKVEEERCEEESRWEERMDENRGNQQDINWKENLTMERKYNQGRKDENKGG